MRSGTKVETNDFQNTIDHFAERCRAVQEEVDWKAEDQSERVQMSFLHGIDSDNVPGIEISAGSSRSSTPSIALNRSSSRHTQNSEKILVEGMRDAARILANAIQSGEDSKSKNKRRRRSSSSDIVNKRIDTLSERIERLEAVLDKILAKLDAIQ